MIGYLPMDTLPGSPVRWYQDKPTPGFPLERLCRVVDTVKVRTATGWARWSYCQRHGWVAPSTHLIEVLT